MKVKKIISLLLLGVYLFATGGTAYASLSCSCVAIESRAAHHSADCPGDCSHGPGCGHAAACSACCAEACPTDAAAKLGAPCCGNHHSIDIPLYTMTQDDHAKEVRPVVLSLPPALAAECPCPAHVPALRSKPVLPPTAVPAAPHLEAVGLRAPPVLV